MEEFSYLGSQPVASLREGVLYVVHSDHLDTPQYLTDTSGNLVWKLTSQRPLGVVEIDEDVDGNGQGVVFNLRIPGRYAQKSSVGLSDGPNTYSYVNNSPINYHDSKG